jgi:hypothetical protein
MRDNKLDLCARAYLECYRSQFKKYTWAYDYADNLIQNNPNEGLRLIVEILKLCRDEQEIAYVASSALEELLHQHILNIAPAVEHSLYSAPAMRAAIRYVWAPDIGVLKVFLTDVCSKLEISSRNSDLISDPPDKVVDE